MNTYDKYWWIIGHPKFTNKDMIPVEISIEPHMVCPSTERVEDYKPLNTKMQFWVEFCPPYYMESDKNWVHSHDTDCDCGGWTYDEAISNLYDLVLEKYGSYTKKDVEEADERVFKISSVSLPQFFTNPNKTEYSTFQSDIQQDYESVFMKKDLRSAKRYKDALIDFAKTATIEQQQEIQILLVNLECVIWEFQYSLKTGIDFT